MQHHADPNGIMIRSLPSARCEDGVGADGNDNLQGMRVWTVGSWWSLRNQLRGTRRDGQDTGRLLSRRLFRWNHKSLPEKTPIFESVNYYATIKVIGGRRWETMVSGEEACASPLFGRVRSAVARWATLVGPAACFQTRSTVYLVGQ